MNQEPEILVEVKGLSKKFSRSLKQGMWFGLKDLLGSIFGSNKKRSDLREGEFWAVKDISFTLKRGDCLGLIGHNGAGKSTLLKMLNGLIRPDEGSITMKGKVGALIELGAGFNPILTGRENIYLNGQILGFSKKQINEKMDAILDFAEIGEFIDSPIQNYSSGMKVRLGFAIAAQMEPDVLIIDEVLAVGDLSFVLKCFNVIDNLLKNTAVIFVSHNMPQVSRVCNGIILLENGKTLFQDNNIAKGIDLYYSLMTSKKETNIVYGKTEDAELLGIQLGNENEVIADQLFSLNHLSDLLMFITIKVRSSVPNPYLIITISDKEQRPIGVCQQPTGLTSKEMIKEEEGYNIFKAKLTMPHINLSKGVYSISLSVTEKFRTLPILRLQSIRNFQVISKNDVWPPIEFEGKWNDQV